MEAKTVLAIIFQIIAFSAYSSMSTLQFHYYQSVFTNLNNQQFWNPLLSWNNKYKNRNKTNGPAFPFSTNLLIFVTDGYHLMQFIFENSLFLSFAIYNNNSAWYYNFLEIRIIYGLVFNTTFEWLLIKK